MYLIENIMNEIDSHCCLVLMNLTKIVYPNIFDYINKRNNVYLTNIKNNILNNKYDNFESFFKEIMKDFNVGDEFGIIFKKKEDNKKFFKVMIYLLLSRINDNIKQHQTDINVIKRFKRMKMLALSKYYYYIYEILKDKNSTSKLNLLEKKVKEKVEEQEILFKAKTNIEYIATLKNEFGKLHYTYGNPSICKQQTESNEDKTNIDYEIPDAPSTAPLPFRW